MATGTATAHGSDIEEIDKLISAKEQQLKVLEQQLKVLRAARTGLLAVVPFYVTENETTSLESRRWVKAKGRTVKINHAVLILLRQHNGEMPIKDMFENLSAGGAFIEGEGVQSEATRFATSLNLSVVRGELLLFDESGKPVDRIGTIEPFSGTVRTTAKGASKRI